MKAKFLSAIAVVFALTFGLVACGTTPDADVDAGDTGAEEQVDPAAEEPMETEAEESAAEDEATPEEPAAEDEAATEEPAAEGAE
ncbi:MAG: hypothetical protein IGR92_06525 [Leptolyngbyaceae cyanobacterium T60_A2020_046]|nr:hypothetical protein [Leptolyngbyaceae cyanobacterium T60_A2020_046]